jgi:hypothetical protein
MELNNVTRKIQEDENSYKLYITSIEQAKGTKKHPKASKASQCIKMHQNAPKCIKMTSQKHIFTHF